MIVSEEARIDYPHDDSSETRVGDDDLDDEHTEFSSIVDPDENPMHGEVEDTITASLAELFPLSGDEIYDHTIPQAEGLEEWPDFSVDSGAAISVGSPEHFPGIKVVPSEGVPQRTAIYGSWERLERHSEYGPDGY